MSSPTTPAAWAVTLVNFWRGAGMGLPIQTEQLAIEYSKRRPDPVEKIHGHDVAGIEGMLVKSRRKNTWYMLYDETIESQGRINFTLAHEFGHYLLHRHLVDEFRCSSGDLLGYDGAESRRREAEANKFASCLLMPADDFRLQIQSVPTSIDLIAHCADRYGTSFTATALKWLELTDEAAMLVVARDGYICWSYSSQKASKQRTYLAPGTQVPQQSLDRFNTESISNLRNTDRILPPGVWHPTLEAIESILLSDKYDLAIFLIRFPSSGLVLHDEEPEDDGFTPFENGGNTLWR